MKYYKLFLFLLLTIVDVSTNAQEVTCEGEQLLNVDVLMGHPGIVSPYKPGHILVFRCTDVNMKMYGQRTIECLSNGKWDNPYPKCGGKCGPPPLVDFADTIEITKNEYDSGERVEYTCFNKYTLVQSHPYSKYLTCEHGKWRGNIKCLKPCSVSLELMDERGIELRWAGRRKIFSPHGDRITFMCQKGRSSIGSDLRSTCNDGVMNLPLCV
ncbi:complement factor H-related protein 1-like [Megalobrama amblycephala]|uniref:complement factor H-related protein 1-like n=1 Tax=Megalobrama amblycephala TaxID=75352 RepID=UPI0020140635|nr:complement factor H-related protein 1-like [Megalobrama amblycephala]